MRLWTIQIGEVAPYINNIIEQYIVVIRMESWTITGSSVLAYLTTPLSASLSVAINWARYLSLHWDQCWHVSISKIMRSCSHTCRRARHGGVLIVFPKPQGRIHAACAEVGGRVRVNGWKWHGTGLVDGVSIFLRHLDLSQHVSALAGIILTEPQASHTRIRQPVSSEKHLRDINQQGNKH